MKRLILFFVFISFTLCLFSQDGPGGIGDTSGGSILEFWINAESGVSGSSPVTSISDLSGNGYTVTINGDPSISIGSLNGRDEFEFDGSGDYLTTDLSINADTFPEVSIFTVYTSDGTTSVGAPWGEDNGGFDRFILRSNNAGPGCSYGYSHGIGCSNLNAMFPTDSTVVTTVMFNEDVTHSSYVSVNGASAVAFTSDFAPESSDFFNIASVGSGNFTFDGEIAELIILNERVAYEKMIIVINYLAAKYGVTLDSYRLYLGADADKGDYDFDVAGIGRDNSTNLVTDAQGTGMVRIMDPSWMHDDEYLFWGHNNAAAEATNTSDIPTGVQARFQRVWYVNERSSVFNHSVNVGSVDIRFELTGYGTIQASNLRLLVDTDNDDDFTDETPISGATHISGTDYYEFSSVSALVDNSRFTLATADASSTPLPVVLDYFTVSLVEDAVDIYWQTLSEVNCDYFEIERSSDSKNWVMLTKVEGNGNTWSTSKYVYRDEFPIEGMNYYRIKQVDIDGTYIYFDVKSISMDYSNSVSIYPSLCTDILYISGVNEFTDIRFYDICGNDISQKLFLKEFNSSKMTYNLSQLESGFYVVSISGDTFKFVKL